MVCLKYLIFLKSQEKIGGISYITLLSINNYDIIYLPHNIIKYR